MPVRTAAALALGCALMGTLFSLATPVETQAEIPAGARCVYTGAVAPASLPQPLPRLSAGLPIDGPTGACSLSQPRSRGSVLTSIADSD
jgi:hypothetical protein